MQSQKDVGHRRIGGQRDGLLQVGPGLVWAAHLVERVAQVSVGVRIVGIVREGTLELVRGQRPLLRLE